MSDVEAPTVDVAQRPTGLVADVGREALDLVAAARSLWSVLTRTLHWTLRGPAEPGAAVKACYEIGNQSVFFLSVTMGFIGMILVFQSALQALVGAQDHPKSVALRKALRSAPYDAEIASHVVEVPGRGVEVLHQGARYRLANNA